MNTPGAYSEYSAGCIHFVNLTAFVAVIMLWLIYCADRIFFLALPHFCSDFTMVGTVHSMDIL